MAPVICGPMHSVWETRSASKSSSISHHMRLVRYAQKYPGRLAVRTLALMGQLTSREGGPSS